jgi:hypothetical protein
MDTIIKLSFSLVLVTFHQMQNLPFKLSTMAFESQDETMRNYHIMPGYDLGHWSFPLSILIKTCKYASVFQPPEGLGFCDIRPIPGKGVELCETLWTRSSKLAVYDMPFD